MSEIPRTFHEHLSMIDRVMKIIMADDPIPLLGGLLYMDLVIFACQCMWHLKDWMKNDPIFCAKDAKALDLDIHSEQCLKICADLANGLKHLSLKSPKTNFSLSPRTGIHVERGIWQEYYYVVCSDGTDNGMELRSLLLQCRDAWQGIINKHYLSNVETESFLNKLAEVAEEVRKNLGAK